MVQKMERQVTEIKLSMPWGHIAGRVYGTAKESKILVVHGILDNVGSFHRLIELLPEDYQYVSIDLPGHGLSSPFPPDMPLKFFDYVYSISLVLDALKWKTCTFLGHSFGAQLGLHFSVLYPGRLDKVILIDALIPDPVDEVRYIQSLYNLNSYAKVPAKLYNKDDVIYALKFKRNEVLTTDAAEAAFERAVTKVGNLYKYNRDPRLRFLICPIFNAQQQREFFKKLPSPVFAIIATHSHTVNTMTARSIHTIQTYCNTKDNLTLTYVRGNHDVHNNYPERVAPHILKILNNNLPSKL